MRRHELHPLTVIAKHDVFFHFRRQLRGKEPGEVVVTLIPVGPDHVMF